MAQANIHASVGVVIREFPHNPGHGFADYLLYVSGKACGVIEAKIEGVPLKGVDVQSSRSAQGLPATLPAWRRPLPFVFDSTGAAVLADALFSGTLQRLFGLVFGQPERSFYATELINLAGAGSGAVQRELARLAQSGLVTLKPVGNQKHYQANPASPIYDELCGVIRKTVGLAEPLRAALAPLATQIKAAFVYGSVAKKEDTASSDIDLMLVSDTLTYGDTVQALQAATELLGREVNPNICTLQDFAAQP